jgi:hypothetical protein
LHELKLAEFKQGQYCQKKKKKRSGFKSGLFFSLNIELVQLLFTNPWLAFRILPGNFCMASSLLCLTLFFLSWSGLEPVENYYGVFERWGVSPRQAAGGGQLDPPFASADGLLCPTSAWKPGNSREFPFPDQCWTLVVLSTCDKDACLI